MSDGIRFRMLYYAPRIERPRAMARCFAHNPVSLIISWFQRSVLLQEYFFNIHPLKTYTIRTPTFATSDVSQSPRWWRWKLFERFICHPNHVLPYPNTHFDLFERFIFHWKHHIGNKKCANSQQRTGN